MACKDCVYLREPMRGFYNQVYCDYHHIHVSNQPYYDASKRCNGYKTKQTNADLIRAMTDEELATWLNCMQSNAYHCGEFGRTNAAYPFDNKAWLEWLKQECTVDKNNSNLSCKDDKEET